MSLCGRLRTFGYLCGFLLPIQLLQNIGRATNLAFLGTLGVLVVVAFLGFAPLTRDAKIGPYSLREPYRFVCYFYERMG